MKFPRHTRSLRNPFDVAPFAAVFFLLVIFLMLAAILPTPGIPLQLPATDGLTGADLPGTDRPTVSVAVDANGRFYFASQLVTGQELKACLSAAVIKSREPLTLVIQADQTVTYGQLVHLTLLARNAGIQNALLATLPRLVSAPDLLP
jgi:biopolymer transport protein ExbD